MSEYKPIPVAEACRIAELFDKEIVVIVAYDLAHQMTHTTTFGVSVPAKDLAAKWGEVCTQALGSRVQDSTWYEDFRATEAAEYKRKIDLLEAEIAYLRRGR